MRWFVPRDEPVRRAFGISRVMRSGRETNVDKSHIALSPFCMLRGFSTAPSTGPGVLLVAPLSGHFAFILRDMVLGLVDRMPVSVTDWSNARCVPLSAGDFGFDDNIAAVLHSIEHLGPGADVIALCQGVMPALAATAILADSRPDLAPRSLTLIGGPVDPLANPTRVVELLRQRSLGWFEDKALTQLGPSQAGAGRMVYPAHHQLTALSAYFYRHMVSGGELQAKLMDDDGIDPEHVAFFDLFTSLMDLPATFFLENIAKVFQAREAWHGKLAFRGRAVDFGAIRNTALMTVEGSADDIAAPGQTSAAHRLCPSIPESGRRRILVEGAGHFGLFHGRTSRQYVVPEIRKFLSTQSLLEYARPVEFGGAFAKRAARAAG